MGVHGLWKILEPAHRPVKLETLARKRLAVDASIWIYQFLKAVRDADGNALSNSHIVGFFRRICKLLFHGIRPVFVFDGGAPVLKRQTIAGRNRRREGRREDAIQTARKLLALQVKRRAEEEFERGRGVGGDADGEEVIPHDAVYVDQLEQTSEQRKQQQKQPQTRGFKKTDQYQLPDMEHGFNELVSQNDLRILSTEELQDYARQFEGVENTMPDDFNIDYSSPFFAALPDADRYRILSRARLRSRLRMGYSKEQLDSMFPDRMTFSKFQIERLTRRNELSQRLLNLQGRDSDFSIGRVAGEKNKEYILVRNEGAEGGWAMSFVGNKGELEGAESRPIDVDHVIEEKVSDSDDEVDFEDVPVEGLNRLPKAPRAVPLPLELAGLQGSEAKELRRALYESRLEQVGRTKKPSDTPIIDALFLGDDTDDVLFGLEGEDIQAEEDLQNAIAMSLGNRRRGAVDNEDEDLQRAVAISMGSEIAENSKGKGKAVDLADISFSNDGDAHDAEFELAVAESMQSQANKPGSALRTNGESSGTVSMRAPPKLPDTLDLSKSSSFLFGKKLSGTSKPLLLPAIKGARKDDKEESVPLPSWFAGGGVRDIMAEVEKAKEQTAKEQREFHQARMQKNVVEIASSDDEDEESKMGIGMYKPPNKRKGVEITTIAVPVDSDEEIPWSDSEDEVSVQKPSSVSQPAAPSPRKEALAPVKPSSPVPPPPKLHAPSPPPDYLEEPDDFDISFDHETTPPLEEIAPEDLEDVEMLRNMEREAEEHARFAAEISHASPPASTAAAAKASYESKLHALRSQQKKDRRDADEVTQTMIHEVQQLLTLFGLPYITAPMEAEAQCAELVRLNLVDGIVTDDSDVFLFGATRVYRHMFNDKHTVQCYLSSDLEAELALTQQRLIAAAQLLGSDYTDGVPHIGPVSAIELLAEFSDTGLEGFKAWWTLVQTGADSPPSSPFRKKFKRANAAKVFLPASFPDHAVADAYLHAIVESDPSPFEWGVPDLDGLRAFLIAALGWSQEHTDQILLPVVRDMNRKMVEGGQVNITSYYGGAVGAGAFAPRVRTKAGSKRMEAAVEMLKGGEKKRPMSMRERFAKEDGEVEEEEVEMEPPKKRGRKKAPAKGKSVKGARKKKVA